MGLRTAGTALILFSVAINPCYAKEAALLNLTAAHFKNTATVSDDPIAETTTVSTQPGFLEYAGPLRTVWHDEYLKGVIERKTGQKSYQLAAFVIYSGSFRSYETARISTKNGPRTVKAVEMQKQVSFCPTGDCTYTERVAFPIDEETLRQVAADSVNGKPTLWRFELIAKAGPNYAGALSAAEFAGFLAKIAETTSTGIAVTATVAKAALQQDLGIEGIAVTATPDQPNRTGILIAGLKNGSVAQKAGIITGDIVYDFDGHPITTLADLNAAVSATRATIPLKLYRGMNSMTLIVQFNLEPTGVR